MDAQIDRHQPLITARLDFAPKPSPPPPIISARMEFPSISIPQQFERSPTPEVRTPETTSRRATTPTRRPTPRPTPINTQKAVNFEDGTSLGSPLTTDDSDDSEEDGEVSKIPKPSGVAGRPKSGGYNLQDKLGWNDTTYERILVSLLNVSLQSILKKLTESGAKTGKDEVRHQ